MRTGSRGLAVDVRRALAAALVAEVLSVERGRDLAALMAAAADLLDVPRPEDSVLATAFGIDRSNFARPREAAIVRLRTALQRLLADYDERQRNASPSAQRARCR